jgi:hypothetical protein
MSEDVRAAADTASQPWLPDVMFQDQAQVQLSHTPDASSVYLTPAMSCHTDLAIIELAALEAACWVRDGQVP